MNTDGNSRWFYIEAVGLAVLIAITVIGGVIDALTVLHRSI